MARRVRDLEVVQLADLPPPCRSCLFWETTSADPPGGFIAGSTPPTGATASQGEADARAKEAWWQATQLEWGSLGKAVYVEGVQAGFAMFAPATHFPRTRKLEPPSDDALLLAVLQVRPEFRDAGLAKLLLHSVLRETHRRGHRALEAYGQRGTPRGSCMLPEAFLLANGFSVVRPNGKRPLLRLDLRRTVRLTDGLGQALEGVVAALSRRERAPAPSS